MNSEFDEFDSRKADEVINSMKLKSNDLKL